MKVTVKFVNTSQYKDGHMKAWFFGYKAYTFIKGFTMMICGIHFNVRESNATEKLIAIGKAMPNRVVNQEEYQRIIEKRKECKQNFN